MNETTWRSIFGLRRAAQANDPALTPAGTATTSRPALANLTGYIDAPPPRAVNLVLAYRAEVEREVQKEIRAELDRIANLPTVTADDGRADAFATGARWTLRMIRDVLNGQEHTP